MNRGVPTVQGVSPFVFYIVDLSLLVKRLSERSISALHVVTGVQ
jgi:hypothetical protein